MAALSFDHRIPCPLNSAALHDSLVRALVDTDRAAFWPRGLNRVQAPKLAGNAPIAAEYRVLGLPAVHRAYRVSDVRPGRGFSYVPDAGHPFTGEVAVDCLDAPGEGSVLHWRGTYHTAAWRPERWFFRAWFEPRFFHALADGVRTLAEEP
jgi:hypothetical protein